MNKACACFLLLMIFTFASHVPADAMENIDNPVLLTLIAYDSVYYRYDGGIITNDSGDTKPVSTLEEYNEGRAVLLFEGIGIADFIDPGISADTILLPWPVAGNPERDSYYAGAMNSVGLSLTSQCIEDPLKLDAALKFIKFINRKEILLQRIANGNIAAAAVLGIDGKKKDVPAISQERCEYAKNATLCETPEYVLPKKIYQELGMKIMNLVYFETVLPGY